jgi:starch synthase (maltosyl-transferring)
VVARLVIENVRPSTPSGHPAKAVVGEVVPVTVDVYRDGHDVVAARVRWRPVGTRDWATAPLRATVNDEFTGRIEPEIVGAHEFQIEAWTDRFATWRHHLEAKAAVRPVDVADLEAELEAGAQLISRLAGKLPTSAKPRARDAVKALREAGCSLDVRVRAGLADDLADVFVDVPDPLDLTRGEKLALWVDRPIARAGAWYELFPRSEGGLLGAAKRLPAIAHMGFDIVYLPPIHPIGRTARKGPNNTLGGGDDDPGSPWAIGSHEGGHTAVHPDLGSLDDFDRFVSEAAAHDLEVALDYALQCSPDHPWVREHPEWFHHRHDGSIRYAENPPKKYQDIYPIDFWPEKPADRKALWQACKEIFDFWIGHGVRIFRVDNPHTKPFAFWEWVLAAVRAENPDVVFLSEAFTRPKVMARLAEIGFSQSYTYFTWRTARWELEQYVNELASRPLADYFRPNFWPNTPDILSGPLRDGPPAAFRLRLLLAALLAPSYGMYSGYELAENLPASDTNEEYLYSEKYEIKERDWDAPGSLAPFITEVNAVRRRHAAFAELRTTRFHGADNDNVIVWSKTDGRGGDTVLCIANLDPHQWHEATLSLDMPALGLGWDETFDVRDELTGQTFRWTGAHPYVRLDPGETPGHVLAVRRLA